MMRKKMEILIYIAKTWCLSTPDRIGLDCTVNTYTMYMLVCYYCTFVVFNQPVQVLYTGTVMSCFMRYCMPVRCPKYTV